MEEKDKMDENDKKNKPFEIEEENHNKIIEKRNTSKDIMDENAININTRRGSQAITEEVINIINKDKYKKYKNKNENEITKIKVEGEEKEKEKKKIEEMSELELLKYQRNHQDKLIEYKLLFEFIDLLKVKTIKFRDSDITFFNELLTDQTYIVKEKNNLNFEEIVFKNCVIQEFDINKYFPRITKLQIINCNLPFELNNYLKVNNLTHLKLDNVGLTVESFNLLITHIGNNNPKNIRVISLKNNNIGYLDFDKFIKIENLEILDVSNNKIPLFFCAQNSQRPKLINLTSNRIIFTFDIKNMIQTLKKNFFFLLSNNYGLLRENNREIYIDYLFEKLSNLDYPIKELSLTNLYVGNCYNQMKKLNLSKFQNSLQELDISFGCINNDDIISLLNENLALYNLKKLNLKRNKITEEIFALLKKTDYHKKFVYLKELDFSENDINIKVNDDNEKMNTFLNFFEQFKSIKKFIIRNTPFELNINDYIEKQYNVFKKDKKKNLKNNLPKEKMIKEIIIDLNKINENLKAKETNVKIFIYNIYNSKFVKGINKFKILEKIYFEDIFEFNK